MDDQITKGSNHKIKRDPTAGKDKRLNKLIADIMSKEDTVETADDSSLDPDDTTGVLILSREDLWKYKCSDSYPPFLDGLGKIHKDGVPLREISRAVGSPGHELMKKVSEILQPLVGTK